MSVLVGLLDTVVRARERALRRWCPHSMVQMSDGPVCEHCGRSWAWRRHDGR